MQKLKHDKYQKIRSGKVKKILISCSKCNTALFYYQKDGDGSLHRCYFNRILEILPNLQTQGPSMQNNLICKCENLIGVPVVHTDKREAYKMIKGNFSKSLIK